MKFVTIGLQIGDGYVEKRLYEKHSVLLLTLLHVTALSMLLLLAVYLRGNSSFRREVCNLENSPDRYRNNILITFAICFMIFFFFFFFFPFSLHTTAHSFSLIQIQSTRRNLMYVFHI